MEAPISQSKSMHSICKYSSHASHCLKISSVINASIYLRHFSSDRSHMYNTKTKTWNAPPPSYDCILPPEDNDEQNSEDENKTNTKNNLKQYMRISNQNVVDSKQQNSEESPLGQIYSLRQLLQRFGNPTLIK